MSILKSFDLKKKEKEEKLDDFNFLFKKTRPSGGPRKNRRLDLVTIGEKTVSIRPAICEQFNIKKGYSGALILDDKKVGLVLRDQNDPELYTLQGGKKRQSFHINVPKNSRDFAKNFKGKYEVSGSRTIDGKYIIVELTRLKED